MVKSRVIWHSLALWFYRTRQNILTKGRQLNFYFMVQNRVISNPMYWYIGWTVLMVRNLFWLPGGNVSCGLWQQNHLCCTSGHYNLICCRSSGKSFIFSFKIHFNISRTSFTTVLLYLMVGNLFLRKQINNSIIIHKTDFFCCSLFF